VRIEIRKPIIEIQRQRERLFLRVIFDGFMGLVCVIILLLLLICESYYKNKYSNEPNTIYIGGPFFCVGFFFWFLFSIRVYERKKQYQKQLLPGSEFYIILTETGYERGIVGVWSESKNWCYLSRYSESSESFKLYFLRDFLPISKSYFKSADEINTFSEFLKSRFGKR
jgi:hypothetical protein